MRFNYLTYSTLLLVVAGATTAYGIVVSRRNKGKSAAEYFLGSRTLGAVGLGSSLFVTSIAAFWLFGSLYGYPEGTSIGVWYGILAAGFVLVLGIYFGPMYLKSKAFTVPQFMALRFNVTTALVFSAITILFYVAIKIPLLLMFAGWVIRDVLGWELMSSTALMLIVVSTGLYTIMGGFPSLIRTQVVQSVIALAIVVSMVVWVAVNPATVASEPLPVFNAGFSFPFLAGILLFLAWHWVADQYTVQRILASRDHHNVRRGTIIAAVLLIGVSILATGFGPAFARLAADEGLADVFRSTASVIFLVVLMATLANDFHSTSTLFTMDFVKTVYDEASDESLVLVGRLCTTLVVVITILEVSAVSLLDKEFMAVLQQAPLFLAPPVAVVFLAGLFWRRMNSSGAMWALALGELFGVVALGIRVWVGGNVSTPGLIGVLKTVDVHMFCTASLVVSMATLVVASLATEAPSAETNMYMSILKRKVS